MVHEFYLYQYYWLVQSYLQLHRFYALPLLIYFQKSITTITPMKNGITFKTTAISIMEEFDI